MSLNKKKQKILIDRIFLGDYSQKPISYNCLMRPGFADTLCITSISNLQYTIEVRQ